MTKQISKILLGLFFIVLTLNSYAQNVNVDIATERALMSRNISPSINADGSPYINEMFSPVRISQYADKIYSARYNAYNGEMEVKISDNKVIALDNAADFEVVFSSNGKTYKSESYVTDTGIPKTGFLVVLTDNKNFMLLKEERVKFYEKVEATSSYQQDKPANFRRESDRFYLKTESKIISISQKKKDLIKLYPELKSYMKKNKLNPKNEGDLITIVQYLSTTK